MRDYARVSPKFWVGPTGRKIRELGPECQVLALYLMTSPHANMIGLYYLPTVYMAHEVGLPEDRCKRALDALCEVGFCGYDDESEVIWVYEMARYQLGEVKPNHKQAIGAAAQYESAPACQYLGLFHDKYSAQIPFRGRRQPIDSVSIPYRSDIDLSDCKATARRLQGDERLQGDCKSDGDDGAERSAAPPAPPASPEVLRIPLNGGKEYVVTEADVGEWEQAFPAVNVRQELRALEQWAKSNPTKRKRNGRAFVTRNLARKQDEGGSRAGPTRGRAPPDEGPLPEYLRRNWTREREAEERAEEERKARESETGT